MNFSWVHEPGGCRRVLCASFLLVVSGCASKLAALERQVAMAEEVEREQAAQMREIHSDIEEIRVEVSRLIEGLRAVEADFLAAEAQYRLVSLAGEDATESFVQARRYYEEAETNYRQIAFVLLRAAGSDSLSLALCGSTMSTYKYRKQLAQEGMKLEGMDVDHIWPRARGGADHPWNYQLLWEGMNRSLGASLWEKFRAWPLETVRGWVVSALITLRCEA